MIKKILARTAIAAALAAGPMLATTVPAHAWAWSSQVTLTGTVKSATHGAIQRVYVSGSDGEKGWATLGSGTYSRSYSFKFYNVPGGVGIPKVNWTVDTSIGSFGNHFGVARPATGANAVRDLCDWGSPSIGC